MKAKIFLLQILVLVFLFTGCELDNYDAPSSILSGNVTYDGKPVGVRSNVLQLELWQPGYQLNTKIPVFIDQDGSFSAVLFDGNYKLVRMSGAPWENNTDTIDVVVKGNTEVDVPVVPYFVPDNVSYQRNGKQITATFTVNRISNLRSLKSARLFLGKTIFTDNVFHLAYATKSASDIESGLPVTLTVAVPDNYSGDFVYARIGVETDGIGELLYSPAERIELK